MSTSEVPACFESTRLNLYGNLKIFEIIYVVCAPLRKLFKIVVNVMVLEPIFNTLVESFDKLDRDQPVSDISKQIYS